MVEEKTTIILGAGASKPYGLPLGVELRDKVIETATGPLPLVLSRLGVDYNEFTEFTRNLSRSGFSSVDAFLEERSKWVEIGKLGIAVSLLGEEFSARDKLFPPKQPLDHWYEILWGKLKTPSWSAFKTNKLSIVTFNYDRSLEAYLISVLNNNFGTKPATIASSLKNMIIHVHGSLGPATTYGAKLSVSSIRTAADRIKIVHETESQAPEFTEARSRIADSENVLFLGFGFHPANMNKLDSFNPSGPVRRISGTRKKIPTGVWTAICHKYGFPQRAMNRGTGTMSEFIGGELRSN
jgi:hypothetical protein